MKIEKILKQPHFGLRPQLNIKAESFNPSTIFHTSGAGPDLGILATNVMNGIRIN